MDWTITSVPIAAIPDVLVGGNIICSQWGKIVRLDFNDLQFVSSALRLTPFAHGAPVPVKGSGSTGSITAHGAPSSSNATELRVVVDDSDGDIALNFNSSVNSSLYYSGSLIYFAR